MKNPRPLSPSSRAILSFIRATPLSRGQIRKMILKAVKRRIDYPIITDFRGVPFILNLDNTTESKALFGRHNLEELGFLKEKTSRTRAVFVDLGANSGFYTQNFLAYGGFRKALAIEPNPAMCGRIKDNYDLLQRIYPSKDRQLIVECCAAGEFNGEVELDLSHGLGAANISDYKGGKTITVRMEPLLNILEKHGIDKVDVMKVDIEGHEDRALIPFFTKANADLFPGSIIIEHTSCDSWKGDLFSVMKDSGYVSVGKTRGNMLLTRQ